MRRPAHLINLSPGFAFRYGRGGGQLGKRGLLTLSTDLTAFAAGRIEAAGGVWESNQGDGTSVGTGILMGPTLLGAGLPQNAAFYDYTTAGSIAWAFPTHGGNVLASANLLKGWSCEIDCAFPDLTTASGVKGVWIGFEAGANGAFAPHGNYARFQTDGGFGKINAEDQIGGLFVDAFINGGSGVVTGGAAVLHTLRVEVDAGNGLAVRSWRIKFDGVLQFTGTLQAVPNGPLFGFGSGSRAANVSAFRFNGSR